MDNFGTKIKKAREEKGWLIRQAAAKLDIDQSLISKFEKGDRRPTREQVEKIANIYELKLEELLIDWLSDKLVYEVQNEHLGLQAMKIAEMKFVYHNKNRK